MDKEYCSHFSRNIMEAFADLPPSRLMAFVILCDHMTFANWDDCGQTVERRDIEEDLAKYAKITHKHNMDKCFKDLCDKGILHKESAKTYRVNPHYAYKGDGKLAEAIQRKWDILYKLPNSKYYEGIPFY